LKIKKASETGRKWLSAAAPNDGEKNDGIDMMQCAK
jgi:hypothetical protein